MPRRFLLLLHSILFNKNQWKSVTSVQSTFISKSEKIILVRCEINMKFQFPFFRTSFLNFEAMTQTEKAEDSEIPSFDFDKQMSALQDAMKTFQRELRISPEKVSKSVTTIQFYCRKILEDPTNHVFRAINKDNKNYRDYVQFVEGAPDILEALGFTLKRNKLVLYLYEEESTPYL